MPERTPECWHWHINSAGFCQDCGARAAIAMPERTAVERIYDSQSERCGHNYLIADCPYEVCHAKALLRRAEEAEAKLAAMTEALSKLLYKFNGLWYVVTTPEHIIDSAAKALTMQPPEALEQQRERIRREMAEECAAIASELEDDDCTAGAVWEAIRHRFGLDQPAPADPKLPLPGHCTCECHVTGALHVVPCCGQPAQQEGSDA